MSESTGCTCRERQSPGLVYLGFGTNLGNREENYETALALLEEEPDLTVVVHSGLREYPPMGPPQPPYLNGAIGIETSLEPEALLGRLHAIEKKLGRVRTIHWGPRTIDLDILFWGNMILETNRLTIPHPGAAERRFVLEPLCEIAPELKDPRSGRTIAQLLEHL